MEKRTVLVLGAGASMPYGFPSGGELRRKIIDGIGRPAPEGSKDSLFVTHLRGAGSGFTREMIHAFRSELMAADTTSIDAFLEMRSEFVKIGKAAIAAVLIPLESEQSLFEPWNQNAGASRPNQAWYQYFASTLRMRFSNWELHRLTIITYNYDRSLDHYLFSVLRASSHSSPEDCMKTFQKIPIIHLHGRLGGAVSPLPFGSPLNSRTIRLGAGGIKIVHEVQENEEFVAANTALDEAEVVCFLGFGYAPDNMARLRVKPNTPGRRVMGTVFNLTEAEQRRLRLGAYLDSAFPSEWDTLRALRESDILG